MYAKHSRRCAKSTQPGLQVGAPLRSRRNGPDAATVLACAVALLTFFATLPVRAQGFQLDRFQGAQSIDDGFQVSRPNDEGHGRWGAVLYLDYANDPLVVEASQGDRETELAAVVGNQLVGHVNVSVGLWNRLVLFGGLQVNLLMRGDSFDDLNTEDTLASADGTGLGDGNIGARVRLYGEREDFSSLALQLTLGIPFAELSNSDQAYSGDGGPSFIPQLLFEMRPGPVRLTFNAGARIRKNANLGTASAQDEITYGFNLTVPLMKDLLDLHLELYGAAGLQDIQARESVPLEGLLGVKYWPRKSWVLGAAAGPGLTRGLGSPDVRAVLTFGYLKAEPEPEPKPEPVLDSDGDGLLDPEDTCPHDPEDRDDFEDSDGCPDPDNDSDGVADTEDSCPLDPEDLDGFEDENGCPDPDNDSDGILDAEDACPLNPEDLDSFEDQDGCPDPDNDGDGVLDVDDQCPTSPGVVEEAGCPKTIRLEKGRIVILTKVEFATGKARILERSEPILQEVTATLQVNPQIRAVLIEGHTDARGRDSSNMDLSRRRASRVRAWLVEHGVDAERLNAIGCGENIPIEPNVTSAGRQANRRVEFKILDEAGSPLPDGCEAAD